MSEHITPAELAALVKAIDSLAYGDLTFSNEPNPFVAENDARVVSAFRAHWPALRTALLALQAERDEAVEAVKRAARHVENEYAKCLGAMGGLSDAAYERYIKEPAYLRIKGDVDLVRAALASDKEQR
jgi:hypothetical protein